MEILKYKMVPGACRLCGGLPLIIETKSGTRWVQCKKPGCHNSTHRHPLVTWPRRRVVDWRESAPYLVAATGTTAVFAAFAWAFLQQVGALP